MKPETIKALRGAPRAGGQMTPELRLCAHELLAAERRGDLESMRIHALALADMVLAAADDDDAEADVALAVVAREVTP